MKENITLLLSTDNEFFQYLHQTQVAELTAQDCKEYLAMLLARVDEAH